MFCFRSFARLRWTAAIPLAALVILIIVLIFLPTGLLGRPEVEKV